MSKRRVYAAAATGRAVLSADRVYRYALWRQWDPALPTVMFIGLNPSTADETRDDPTIRRCIGFARSWGCGQLAMLNLFAYRSPRPRDLLYTPQAVGLENDDWLAGEAATAALVVAAWGQHGRMYGRDLEVRRLLAGYEMQCLGRTADGCPHHPLYLAHDCALEPYHVPRPEGTLR